MRSQLLISIEQLPTIREDTEVKAHCDRLTADAHIDSGLEDYVKSIQTLAQPSSLSTDYIQLGQSRSQRRIRSRLRSSLRVCETKVLAVAQETPYYSNLIALETNSDPLAWLYRQNGKENQEYQETSAAAHIITTPRVRSANSLNLHKIADTPRRPQSSKIQSLENLQDRRNRPSRLQKKCYSACSSSQRSTSRLKPLLPVIYEL